MKIIKFNAVWCPSCLVSRPIWKKVKEKFPNLDVVEYDYDIDCDMVEKYNIGDKLPVVLKIDESGKEINRLIGEKTIEEIENFIKD